MLWIYIGNKVVDSFRLETIPINDSCEQSDKYFDLIISIIVITTMNFERLFLSFV